MTKRQMEDYLRDILDAVAAIEQFTSGIQFEAFSQNLEKVFAVSKAIEIIGEAVKRIPDSVRSQYPDIPWRDIAGMPDKLIHDRKIAPFYRGGSFSNCDVELTSELRDSR